MVQNQNASGNYSEMTANLIDKEIRRIIDEQHDRAVEILRTNRDIINQAAKNLLEKEIIEGEELRVLSDAITKRNDAVSNTRRELAA